MDGGSIKKKNIIQLLDEINQIIALKIRETDAIADNPNNKAETVLEDIFLKGAETRIPKNIAGKNKSAAIKSCMDNHPLNPRLISAKTDPAKKKAFSVGRTTAGSRW